MLLLSLPLLAGGAEAWTPGHHADLTEDFVRWSPLASHLSSTDIAHMRQASMDIDGLVATSWNQCLPTNLRYVSTDGDGWGIRGGGECQRDFPHGNLAHTDQLGAENHFQAEYGDVRDIWDDNRHGAAHHLGHMLHYLEDVALPLHTCDLTDPVDCMDSAFHHDLESQARSWYDANAYYCNKRLDLCGNVRDPYSPVGLEYAFRNFPASLETNDGKSDLADMLTLLGHAQGWSAKDNGDLPDDATATDYFRTSVGEDWWDSLNQDCVSCTVNRDITMTALWELARVARGTLDKLAQDVGVGLSDLGNDQVELIYTKIEETDNTDPFNGNPDLYARFHIDHRSNGVWEYVGETRQDVNNDHTIHDYTIASNERDDSGSGNWLPPMPKHRTTTLRISSDVIDDDPAPNPDDHRGTVSLTWSALTYGEKCGTVSASVTVCIRATRLGDRWDETPPSTSSSFSGALGNDGWHTSAGHLTLTGTDDRSGVKGTHYRFSGGSWSSYTGPVYIGAQGSTTVEFYSVDNYGNQEAVRSTTIKVDSRAPSTSSSLDGTLGGGGWYRSSVTVTLSCSDSAPGSGCDTTRYRVNGGAWATYDGAFSVASEGANRVEADSTDVAGNLESVKTTWVRIDTTPPATTHRFTGTVGDNGWYRSAVTLTLDCSDASSGCASSRYRVDGGAWVAIGGPVRISQQGTLTVEYDSTDVAGNREATRSSTVKIDLTPPTTSRSLDGTVGDNGWYRSAVTVTLTASDAVSGVASTEYRVNGGVWQSYGGPFALADDHYTVAYRSRDVAGWVEGERSVTFRSDATPPTITSQKDCTLGLADWCLDAATVTGTASDALSGMASLRHRIGTGPWAAFPGSSVHTEEGEVDEVLEARDLAGNVATTTHRVKVDLFAPTNALTRPVDGHVYVADVDLGRNPDGAETLVVGHLTLEAAATDSGSGVDRVDFYVDGSLCGSDDEGADGWAWTWDLECAQFHPFTPTTLQAVTVDHAGRTAASTRLITKLA